MSTVKRVVGNYTISANSVVLNTLANVVTSTSGSLNINSTAHIYVPSPIGTSGSATLANGVAGQSVTLTSLASGTWTVLVTSAGWTSYLGSSTSGNVVFNNPNTSVTLRWTPEIYGWMPVASVGSINITS